MCTVSTRSWARIPLRPTFYMDIYIYIYIYTYIYIYIYIYIYSLIPFKWYEHPKKVFPTVF